MTCALQVHLMEWVRAVIATTLGVGPDQDLPPLIMQQETHSIWEQIRMFTPACMRRPTSHKDVFSADHILQNALTLLIPLVGGPADLPCALHVHSKLSYRLQQNTWLWNPKTNDQGIQVACTHTVSPLEGHGAREWACFERVLVVRDAFAGGERTWATTEDARAFRARIYAQHGARQGEGELPWTP